MEENTNYENQINALGKTLSENNKLLQEIEELLVIQNNNYEQDKKEEIEKEQLQAETEKQEKEESEKALAEEKASADSETETYTELLTEVRDGINLTNQLLSGTIFFMGVIFGLLFIKILWERFSK